jgi:hypothetical protein
MALAAAAAAAAAARSPLSDGSPVRQPTPLLATLEANGSLRLLRYPCVVPGVRLLCRIAVV